MHMNPPTFLRPLLASATALALLSAPSAFAATRTWSGTTNATWSTGTNWGANATAPVAGDTIAFIGLNNVANTNDLAADTSFAAINFTGNNNTTSGNFTLSGNRITLGGNITTTGAGVGGGILSDTIALDIVLSANSTISTGGAAAARAHNLTISGNISGGFGITKTAGIATFGSLTLSGNNTFTGGVILTSGPLKLGHASALGTGALTINGGSIDNSSGAALTLANNNPITINSDFTFTGTNDLNLGNGAVSLGSAAGTVRQITVSAGTLTVNGSISDGATATAITKLGTGTLTFGGNNTFTGGINVNNGWIGATHNNAWGTGVVTFAGGDIDTTKSLTIANDLVFSSDVGTNALSNDMVYTGNVSGTGNLSFNGFTNGSNTFTGNNTGWSGNITLSGAGLRLGHVNAAGTGTINFAGNANTAMESMSSSADLSGGNGVANNIVNNNAGTSFILDNNLKLSGVISGAGTTRLSSGSTGTLFLTGNNTYTGFTSIQSSVLDVTAIGNGGDSRNIGASSNAAINLVIGGGTTTGTLKYTGAGETTDRLFTIGSAQSAYNTSTGSGPAPVVTLNATVTSQIDSSGTGALVFGNTGNLLVGNALNTIFELTGNNTDNNTIASIIGNTATRSDITTTAGTTTSSTNGNPNRQISVPDTTGIMVGDIVSGTGITGNVTVGAVLSSTRLSIVTGATLNQTANATLTFKQPDVSLNKTSVKKSGVGTWVLTGNNTYTGSTLVSVGTLVINGSIATSSGVQVDSGAVLAGSGLVSAISGAGWVNPGNSPGILTATTADLSGGLDFSFEFGTTGSPTWSNATASVNDVLHLTNTSDPFTSTLATAANVFDIYLGVASITGGDSFNGGFFAGTADFSSIVASGTYNYYVLGNGAGSHAYNGTNYYTLAEYNSGVGSSWTIDHGTFAVTGANFATGTVDGYVQQFSVVPEPAAWLLAAFGLTTAVVFRRRRQD